MPPGNALPHHTSDYFLPDCQVSNLTDTLVLQHSSAAPVSNAAGLFQILPDTIDLRTGTFSHLRVGGFPTVTVQQEPGGLRVSCPCPTPKNRLCEHQTQVLLAILHRTELRVFFDDTLRYEKIRQVARDYGLAGVSNPDEFFRVEYTDHSLRIQPKRKELFPMSGWNEAYWQAQGLFRPGIQLPAAAGPQENCRRFVVLGQHRFYNHLSIELAEAPVTREGKPKNPVQTLDPQELIWQTDQPEEVKFYTSIARFRHNFGDPKPESDIAGLKALLRNPLRLGFFYHDAKASENLTAHAIVPVQLENRPLDLRLSVHRESEFYEISAQLLVDDRTYDLQKLALRFGYFVGLEKRLCLIDDAEMLRVIQFFKQHHSLLLIHASRFEEFRETFLAPLEHRIRIAYSYVKPATRTQLEQNGFSWAPEKIIYLSDSENYVLITPVLRYGKVEVPVLSKKQIYSTDHRGNPFLIERDEALELQFVASLTRQHPDFREQLHQTSLYLHRTRFLAEDWFPEAFEEWQRQQITVLGFNELKNNRLNPHKAKVSVHVDSGVDWFETTLDVRYGKQRVSLKHLHKAVRNKSRYVQLDDGTMGILPAEWLERLSKYFQAGEVVQEIIRTQRINFAGIAELYTAEMLTEAVKAQLATYQARAGNFETIRNVTVPPELQTTLREYQRQGLNWLHFLDEFGFGGCLADDMGLGKTIQIIAFILSQRNRGYANTNLIVVPTSLLFNWQAEVQRFAPSIRMCTFYGSDREKAGRTFDAFEIVLTTYGTLLADIKRLKEYSFNYVILDESQAIKNPESQRYKAARLLRARNRLVLTGTPIENNTFDLYGQLSFACPGLLGSRQYFRDHYSVPIDRFGDKQRAAELRKKVHPFILRRTKQQVAAELPDKTEMVIYCEMSTEQRRVYEAYTQEFRNFLNTREEGDISRESLHVLQGLTKLRQICNSPALLRDEEFYGSASAKMEVLLEEICNRAPEHKILVFSQFVSMLDLIGEELKTRDIPFVSLTGKTSDRAAQVERFQTNPDVRIFLLSLKAGGTGLNLTEADYVYLVDPWWNPAVENQAIDRSHRIGQQKKVVAVRLICPGTIEEKMMQLQASKKDLFQDLIRTDTGVLKSLSKRDLLALLG